MLNRPFNKRRSEVGQASSDLPTSWKLNQRTVYPVAQPGGEAAGSQPAKRNSPPQEDLPDVGNRPSPASK